MSTTYMTKKGKRTVWKDDAPKPVKPVTTPAQLQKRRCVVESRKIVDVLGKLAMPSWERCNGTAMRGDVVCPIHRRFIDASAAEGFLTSSGSVTIRAPIKAFLANSCKITMKYWDTRGPADASEVVEPADGEKHLYEVPLRGADQFKGLIAHLVFMVKK